MEGTTDGVFDPLVLVIDDNNVVDDDDEPDDGLDAVDDVCVESGIANGVGWGVGGVVGCGVGSGVGGTGVGADYNNNNECFFQILH